MITLALLTLGALALSRTLRPAEHAVGIDVAPEPEMERYRRESADRELRRRQNEAYCIRTYVANYWSSR